MRDQIQSIVNVLRCSRPGCACQQGPSALGTWRLHCPVCDSGKVHRTPSLMLRQAEDGKPLVCCHQADCGNQQAVLEALRRLGVWPHRNAPGPDLKTAPSTASVRPLQWWAEYCQVPLEFVRTLPLAEEGDRLVFRFGDLPVRKVRRAGTKEFSWEPAGAEVPPLWPLPPETLPEAVYLAEGESDAVVLRYVGLEAFAVTKGAGGALTVAQVEALRRRGVRMVVLVYDVDDAGRAGSRKVAEVLRAAGLEVATVDLVGAGLVDPLRGEKDLKDGWTRWGRGDPEQFRRTLLEAVVPSGFSSNHIGASVGTKGAGGAVEVRACDLQAQAREEGLELESLPLLGRHGYFFRGWTHLLSAYPKIGKTELLVRVVAEWNETILWFTEESIETWKARLAGLPFTLERVVLFFGLGVPREVLLRRIAQGTEKAVIIDTDKLLGIRDPNDAGEVTEVLVPFISTCREQGKTLVIAHHERKAGGQHGEGISGSHAFLGLVDIALELLPDAQARNRRLIRGYGRVVSICELVYELREDGLMVALGAPEVLSLEATKERVLALLTEDWQTLREIMEGLGDPKPSDEQVRRALNALVEEGKADRDPPPGVRSTRAHAWRLRRGGAAFLPTEPFLRLEGKSAGPPSAQVQDHEEPDAPPSWALQLASTLPSTTGIPVKRTARTMASLFEPPNPHEPDGGPGPTPRDLPRAEPQEDPPHPPTICVRCRPAPRPGYYSCTKASRVLLRLGVDLERHVLRQFRALAFDKALLESADPEALIVILRGGRGWGWTSMARAREEGVEGEFGAEPQLAVPLTAFRWTVQETLWGTHH